MHVIFWTNNYMRDFFKIWWFMARFPGKISPFGFPIYIFFCSWWLVNTRNNTLMWIDEQTTTRLSAKKFKPSINRSSLPVEMIIILLVIVEYQRNGKLDRKVIHLMIKWMYLGMACSWIMKQWIDDQRSSDTSK